MSESKNKTIVDTLKREILSGRYSITRAFPSERALAVRFKASRPTLRINCEQIADAAFERLIARIAKPGLPPTEIFLPAELVVRESTSRNSVRRPAKKGVLR